MATHSSILVWRIPWTEEPGPLQSIGSLRMDAAEATEHSIAHSFADWTTIFGHLRVFPVFGYYK